jgi:hypothetical protein
VELKVSMTLSPGAHQTFMNCLNGLFFQVGDQHIGDICSASWKFNREHEAKVKVVVESRCLCFFLDYI